MEKLSRIARSVGDVLKSPWTPYGSFEDARYQHHMMWDQGQFSREYIEDYGGEPWFDSRGRQHLVSRDYDLFDYVVELVVMIARIVWYGFFPCAHPRWVDDSYGGPDGGCMAGHCPDCGESHYHPMY